MSLTSYPPRFGTLAWTLRGLLSQSVTPDDVVLWLDPDARGQLPASVEDLVRHGLTIREAANNRSYTKIIPALAAFPDAFIAVADDDTYYPRDWLAHLVGAWRSPEEILCRRAHVMAFGPDGLPLPYRQWSRNTPVTRAAADIFPTGVGGVLYPPSSLPDSTSDVATFSRLCPTSDDIWLWWKASEAGRRFRRVGPRFPCLSWEGSQDVRLYDENVTGGKNDLQMAALIAAFGWPIGGSGRLEG